MRDYSEYKHICFQIAVFLTSVYLLNHYDDDVKCSITARFHLLNLHCVYCLISNSVKFSSIIPSPVPECQLPVSNPRGHPNHKHPGFCLHRQLNLMEMFLLWRNISWQGISRASSLLERFARLLAYPLHVTDEERLRPPTCLVPP